MGTQKDLEHTNIKEKASSQNLNKKLNIVAVNKINIPHHKINKFSKSTFAPATIKIISSITRKTVRTKYNFHTEIFKKAQPQHQTQS